MLNILTKYIKHLQGPNSQMVILSFSFQPLTLWLPMPCYRLMTCKLYLYKAKLFQLEEWIKWCLTHQNFFPPPSFLKLKKSQNNLNLILKSCWAEIFKYQVSVWSAFLWLCYKHLRNSRCHSNIQFVFYDFLSFKSIVCSK